MPVRLAGVGTVGGVAIEKRSCGPGELNAFVASVPSPTDDEVSITTDGRRLHSAEAVIAFVAKLKGEDFVEEVVRERTASNPEFPALVEAALSRREQPASGDAGRADADAPGRVQDAGETSQGGFRRYGAVRGGTERHHESAVRGHFWRLTCGDAKPPNCSYKADLEPGEDLEAVYPVPGDTVRNLMLKGDNAELSNSPFTVTPSHLVSARATEPRSARARHGGPRRSWLALTVWPSGSSRRGRTHEANLGGPPQIPVRAPCYPVNRGTIGARS